MSRFKIEYFPEEIKQKMLERQYEQTKKKDITVFYKRPSAGAPNGGFTWDRTVEGARFWGKVIDDCDFDTFYARYPKKLKEITTEEGEVLLFKEQKLVVISGQIDLDEFIVKISKDIEDWKDWKVTYEQERETTSRATTKEEAKTS
jgi:hypothetical protein